MTENVIKDQIGKQGTVEVTTMLEWELVKLKQKVTELEEKLKLPGRCRVCGEPTDGYVRFFWVTHWYCKKHFPIGFSNISTI